MDDYLAGNLKSQKRQKQIARKMVKSPASKKRKIEEKISNNQEDTEEVQFSPPLIFLEELKKISQETKHRDEMKAYILDKGFNPKRFGRMSTETRERHVNEIKEKESLNDKDTDFVQHFEEALSQLTQQQQEHQPQQHQEEQQPQQQKSKLEEDEALRFATDVEKAILQSLQIASQIQQQSQQQKEHIRTVDSFG